MSGDSDEVRLGGSRLVVRRAGAGDRAALEAMFQRCSPATVYQRFHGQVRAFPRAYLDEALAGGDVHYAVVCYSGCEAVALASCRASDRCRASGGPGEGGPGEGGPGEGGPGEGGPGEGGPGEGDGPGEAELGILIEDAWQRRGLGGLLLDRLVAHAADHGIGALQAQMLTEQDWITGMLARHGSWTSAFGRGVREVTLHLGASAAEASAAGALSLGGGTG